MRNGKCFRKTSETDIEVSINLDGSGKSDLATGIGFFDHMLDQLARHSMVDLRIRSSGDLHIDNHHTVEDVGICIGKALSESLGDKNGIKRYASTLLPMDDALIQVALDLSGRPYLSWQVKFPTNKIGTFDTELFEEFFRAVSSSAGLTLHITKISGINSHHIGEAVFKAVAQALRGAVEIDSRRKNKIPSTKGSL
jgi:imidazoleglycerol-phosphate dehydratase